MKKTYEVSLPVFKQGDDFNNCLESSNYNIPEAFKMMSKVYTEAADICRKMASVYAEHPKATVFADGHMIAVEGLPDNQIEVLEKDEYIIGFENECDCCEDCQDESFGGESGSE